MYGKNFRGLIWLKPNTHRRRRPTQLSSCVVLASAVCIGLKMLGVDQRLHKFEPS